MKSQQGHLGSKIINKKKEEVVQETPVVPRSALRKYILSASGSEVHLTSQQLFENTVSAGFTMDTKSIKESNLLMVNM